MINENLNRTAIREVEKNLLSSIEYSDLALLFKLFADPNRIKLLHALEQKELCGSDLACLLGISKSAVSHQLKSLKMTNLIRSRREGQNIFYSLSDQHIKMILDIGLTHLREK